MISRQFARAGNAGGAESSMKSSCGQDHPARDVFQRNAYPDTSGAAPRALRSDKDNTVAPRTAVPCDGGDHRAHALLLQDALNALDRIAFAIEQDADRARAVGRRPADSSAGRRRVSPAGSA